MAAKRLCSIDGCDKPSETRGWCKRHYGRWYRNGSPTGGLRHTPGYGTCSIEGCGRVGKLTRGWCSKHYQRWQENGDPLVSKIDREGPKECTASGCSYPTVAKGLCAVHYEQRRSKLRYEDGAEARHAKHGAINRSAVEDAAYIAGLIDADGVVTASMAGRGKTPKPMVLVVNGDYSLIVWLKEVIGGGCAYRTKTKPTRPDQNARNWNPVHRYQITGWKALALLAAVRPFMRVKAARADLVSRLPVRGRDFSQSASDSQISEASALFVEIRRLNRRGMKMAA